VKLAGIPRKLVIYRQEPRDDTRTELVLKSLSRDVSTPTLEGFALQGSTKNEKLTRLARKVDESTDAEIESHLKNNIKLLKKATADKDILTVYFLHTEIGLQRHIDEPLIDISALAPLIHANADIAEFAQARTKKQQTATIRTLQRISSKRPDRAHFLTILQANNRVALGDLDVAEALYLDGLEVNLFLTGAWVDLGDLYFKKSEMKAAWCCWEVARRIDAAHPVLRSVNDLEKRLQADFPEYFELGPPPAR
jgi:tetratricopeptide (TPR) repeat protein